MSRSQLSTKPVTSADINEYLEATDDFRLEIEIFQACVNNCFRAQHGGSYSDPVTRLNRQYDIRAFHCDRNRILRLAIECKNLSENYPLVVSRIPRRVEESYNSIIFSRLERFGESPAKTQQKSSDLFKTYELVGKSTIQVGRRSNDGTFVTGDAEVYDKWAQAIASSYDLVEDACSDWSRVGINQNWAATVVQPVLVLSDRTLWVADYSDSGALSNEPYQINECSIYLNKEITVPGALSYRVSHLRVFTKSGFIGFLQQVKSHPDALEEIIGHPSDVADWMDKCLKE